MDALLARIDENPEEILRMLESSPAGAVVIARIAEKSGALERAAPAAESAPISAGPAKGFVDVLMTVIEAGQEVPILGFELTDSQRAQVRARASSSPWAATRARELDVDGLVEEADGAESRHEDSPYPPPVLGLTRSPDTPKRARSAPNATRGTNTRSASPCS